MLERDYQAKLIRKLKNMFPTAVILKNDPNYIQGFPDLLILKDDRWAALETKRSEKAHKQPNQEYYVNKLCEMSYAGFIYPENEREILNEVRSTLESDRATCVSKRK
jgi:hypothetical protein